ncbi:hypothetical protein I4U23_029327 [Adineta vaga]|nr:hypothetical protein I4U23_029327 [Adineta vaga]
MDNQKLIVVLTAVIGLIPIVFGIIGLATSSWIKIALAGQEPSVIYSLFQQCITEDNSIATCIDISPSFKTIQGLEIAGVVIIGVGVIIAVVLKILFPKKLIQLITPLLPMVGSILILVGSLLYAKYVIEHFSTFGLEIGVGYSMILIIIACIFGFFATVYLSFSAGYAYGIKRSTVNFI